MEIPGVNCANRMAPREPLLLSSRMLSARCTCVGSARFR